MNLKDKRVTIIGAARSGIAAAELVLDLGGLPRILDSRSEEDLKGVLCAFKGSGKVCVETGGHTSAFVQDSDLVVLSPGVRRDAEPVQWAREKGIPVWGEIELAWRCCRRPVIAVTGSNGKTTTVNLIARVLEAAGKKACLCGNVGVPYSGQARRTDVDVFVLELSSFQLEQVETFRPSIAVLLNFSQNHLDRHADMREYLEAKARIFMNQAGEDFAVLNARDEISRGIVPRIRATVRWFNLEGQRRNPNHLAVLEVARIFQIPNRVTEKVFSDFPGVEHRMEKVRVIDGVRYVNDSKSTTVEAGRWALERMDVPVVMIAGGSDKCLDYTPLRDLVRKKVRAMIALGVIKDQLKETFGDVIPVDVIPGGMKDALARARALARPGECVLLSPMTASFDMFDDYEHRGRVFKEIVKGL